MTLSHSSMALVCPRTFPNTFLPIFADIFLHFSSTIFLHIRHNDNMFTYQSPMPFLLLLDSITKCRDSNVFKQPPCRGWHWIISLISIYQCVSFSPFLLLLVCISRYLIDLALALVDLLSTLCLVSYPTLACTSGVPISQPQTLVLIYKQ